MDAHPQSVVANPGPHGGPRDEEAYQLVITTCCNARQTELAVDALRRMVRAQIPAKHLSNAQAQLELSPLFLDHVSWSCGRLGGPEILDVHWCLAPATAATYTALIASCAERQYWGEGAGVCYLAEGQQSTPGANEQGASGRVCCVACSFSPPTRCATPRSDHFPFCFIVLPPIFRPPPRRFAKPRPAPCPPTDMADELFRRMLQDGIPIDTRPDCVGPRQGDGDDGGGAVWTPLPVVEPGVQGA